MRHISYQCNVSVSVMRSSKRCKCATYHSLPQDEAVPGDGVDL